MAGARLFIRWRHGPHFVGQLARDLLQQLDAGSVDSIIIGNQDARGLALQQGAGRRKLLRLSSNNPQLFDTAGSGQFL